METRAGEFVNDKALVPRVLSSSIWALQHSAIVLHLVNPRLGCPASKLLSIQVKWDREKTPQRSQ